ncbi:hypothetical protein GGQ74_002704 [Desulfobaculum xiamenense]|uniref:YqgF/RNase H-like domain-containing protein n=1 Tax=Desulfobaculum xiamenense TaxID=995050 RepID=A0A846QPV1_9BACT|nr:hypothetical protein [Desulfobaculum xiamenense]NJB69010.1 hypothetical protein [Desulfobaculum xiamenense]
MSLLAVDLGIRTGLALFAEDGRLVWYRSQNFGSHARLRRGAPGVLRSCDTLTSVILEGGGSIANIWEKEALRFGLPVEIISAETWRADFLKPSIRNNGPLAKLAADDLARRVIDASGAKRPTSVRHDAAEAILIGLWGAIRAGWVGAVPW